MIWIWYTCRTGAMLKLCNTQPPFKGNIFVALSTPGVENGVSARSPNLTSTSCDLDLWLSDPEVNRSCPSPGDHLCQFSLKSVFHFKNIPFYYCKRCIFLKRTNQAWYRTNERTDGRTRYRVVYQESLAIHSALGYIRSCIPRPTERGG